MGELTVLNAENIPSTSADLTAEQLEELNRITGQGNASGGGGGLQRLSINYDAEYVDEDDEDAEPITLKRGYYKITVPIGEGDDRKYVTAFAKTANFRPYLMTYHYSVYDSDNNASALNTTRFKEWDEVVLDDKGAEFRAKQYKSKATKLYPEWEGDIKCIRSLYGTVSLEGARDMHGNEVEVADVPCIWYTKGSSFMPVGDALDALKKQGKTNFIFHSMVLNSRREKNGGTTFFVVEPEWDDGEHQVNKEVIELLNKFSQTVEAENEQIVTAFKKAKSEKNSSALADAFSGGDLDADFEDDVEVL